MPGMRCITQKVVSAIISLYLEIAMFRRQPAIDYRPDLYALPAEVKAAWGLLGSIAGYARISQVVIILCLNEVIT